MRAVFLANSADKTIHRFVELGSFNANVIILLLSLRNDLAFLSDSLGGDEVISSNHTDNDTSFLASLDSTWHFRSDDIVDTEDGNKSKSIALSVLLLSILDNTHLIRGLVVLFTEISRLNITVSDSDCAKSLLSVTFNDSINLRALVVSDLLSASIGGYVVRALLDNQFRSTLAKKAFVITSLTSSIASDSGHAFTVRRELEAHEFVLRACLVFGAKFINGRAATLKHINHSFVSSAALFGCVASD